VEGKLAAVLRSGERAATEGGGDGPRLPPPRAGPLVAAPPRLRRDLLRGAIR